MNQPNHDQALLIFNSQNPLNIRFRWSSHLFLLLFFFVPGEPFGADHPGQTYILEFDYFDTSVSCNVTNTNDDGPGSLRDGINCIGSGDTLFFDPGMINETIILVTSINIDNDIIIYATPSQEIWIDGTDLDSTLHIMTGATVELININIVGGNGPNGVVWNQGNLILNKVTIAGDDSPGTIFLGDGAFEMKNESSVLISLPTSGMISDIDGNEYETVKIGSQWWMAENLKTTRCNDGTLIPLVSNDSSWQNLLTPGYCWYNNDSIAYADPYGALYNYYSVADTNSSNICPIDWHVPSSAEWTTLTGFLGGTFVAGGKMKETGTAHWANPNTGATNESGFTGLPGGIRVTTGSYGLKGSTGYLWSSTKHSSISAGWFRKLRYDNDDVGIDYFNKKDGMSVRCVRY